MSEKEEQNLEQQESESKEEELDEEEKLDTSSDEDDDDAESSQDSFLTKAIKKQKRAIKKVNKKVKNEILSRLQILIAIGILVLVLAWGTVEKVLDWASGFTSITVESKTTDNGCYEIVTTDGSSYCLDEQSYELAQLGVEYHLEEYQYEFRLRVK